MQLAQITSLLESIAPLAAAESWDNVGLLVGDPNQTIARIMLTIDYTQEVADEAKKANCDLVVSYHPPIFQPLKKLTAGSLIFDAIRHGMAIYSPHTALDASDGGTNDTLADAIGLTDRRPLQLEPSPAANYKLVVFVPTVHLEKVSKALFDAGAGHIGNYSSCSFRAEGIGSFFPEADANPAIGQRGILEQVPETRLEMILPIDKAQYVVAALRKAHPYEEPAFDLILLAADTTGRGQGRIGSLPHTDRGTIIDHIKRQLDLPHILIAGPATGAITRAAVCAGSCGKLLDSAISAGAQLYLTGELRHHDAIKAAAAGVTVICTLHSNSERAVLKRLKNKLEQTPHMPPITISTTDRDPFTIA
jgi:dinuclear metal center YbgI/SA1388 family protein